MKDYSEESQNSINPFATNRELPKQGRPLTICQEAQNHPNQEKTRGNQVQH